MRPWLATTAAALVVVGIVATISVMVQSGQPVTEPPRPNPTSSGSSSSEQASTKPQPAWP